MKPDECIYHRAGDQCVCWRLGHVKPHCPYYAAGVCTCGGMLGVHDMLRVRSFVMEQPAPTLMRWRA